MLKKRYSFLKKMLIFRVRVFFLKKNFTVYLHGGEL